MHKESLKSSCVWQIFARNRKGTVFFLTHSVVSSWSDIVISFQLPYHSKALSTCSSVAVVKFVSARSFVNDPLTTMLHSTIWTDRPTLLNHFDFVLIFFLLPFVWWNKVVYFYAFYLLVNVQYVSSSLHNALHPIHPPIHPSTRNCQ